MAETETPNYESGECPQCGNEYTDLRKHWSLSSSCSAPEGRGTYATVECSHCGTKHEKERHELRENENSYCSHECRHKGTRNGEFVECAWCGESVYKPNCHLSEAGGYELNNHFCDKDCEQEYKRSNWTLENHPNWEGGKVTAVCERCGGEYKVKKAKQDTTRFCSRECQGRHLGETKDNSGRSNPAWEGGKGGIEAVRRFLSDRSWHSIRKGYIEQAGDGCEMCGRDDAQTQVHHIIPIAAGGTHDECNLLITCPSCHRKAEEYVAEDTEPILYRFAE